MNRFSLVLNNGEEYAEKLLNNLEKIDLQAAEKLKREVFYFDDLLLIDDRSWSFQTLLREISNDELLTALKGATDRLKEKVFCNMSTRAAEMMRDDLEMIWR